MKEPTKAITLRLRKSCVRKLKRLAAKKETFPAIIANQLIIAAYDREFATMLGEHLP